MTRVGDLRGQSIDTLRRGFKLQTKLTALSAEAFQLLLSGGGVVAQTLRFAIKRNDALLGLGDAVAHGGGCGHGLKNGVTTLFLPALDFDERRRSGCRFLLALLQFLLRVGHISIGRLERGTVGLQLLLKTSCLLLSVGDLSLRSGGAGVEFGAALLVGATASGGAIQV